MSTWSHWKKGGSLRNANFLGHLGSLKYIPNQFPSPIFFLLLFINLSVSLMRIFKSPISVIWQLFPSAGMLPSPFSITSQTSASQVDVSEFKFHFSKQLSLLPLAHMEDHLISHCGYFLNKNIFRIITFRHIFSYSFIRRLLARISAQIILTLYRPSSLYVKDTD